MLDTLPTNGLVIVAKRDCPTCVLVEPVMQSLDRAARSRWSVRTIRPSPPACAR